jgi:hypothetical protein
VERGDHDVVALVKRERLAGAGAGDRRGSGGPGLARRLRPSGPAGPVCSPEPMSSRSMTAWAGWPGCCWPAAKMRRRRLRVPAGRLLVPGASPRQVPLTGTTPPRRPRRRRTPATGAAGSWISGRTHSWDDPAGRPVANASTPAERRPRSLRLADRAHGRVAVVRPQPALASRRPRVMVSRLGSVGLASAVGVVLVLAAAGCGSNDPLQVTSYGAGKDLGGFICLLRHRPWWRRMQPPGLQMLRTTQC